MASPLSRLHVLLKLTGLIPYKTNLVLSYSNGRIESSKELTNKELLQLNNYLQDEYNKKQGKHSDFWAGERMRRNIIAMAHEMGWKLPNGKADMHRVNDWCCKYGFGKKELNKYSSGELQKLLSVFKEKVYIQYLNGL